MYLTNLHNVMPQWLHELGIHAFLLWLAYFKFFIILQSYEAPSEQAPPHRHYPPTPALSVGRVIVRMKCIKGGGSKLLPLDFRCNPIRLAAIVSFCSELFLVNRYPDIRVEPPLDSANDAVLQWAESVTVVLPFFWLNQVKSKNKNQKSDSYWIFVYKTYI